MNLKTKSICKYILSFTVPAFLILAVMWYQKMWIFGDNSMLLWDMEIQYVNIYNWFYDVLHGNASLFYDFSKSLGGNMYGVFCTYLTSPINLLIYFFPPERINNFLTLSTIIKISLSGLFCNIYLTKRFNINNMPIILIFSTSYALIEYNVSLCSNLHFLDVIYLLPLMALGVYKFVSANKKVLLFLMVMLSMMCNWYIGYMAGLFCGFYFFFEMAIQGRLNIKKDNVIHAIKFVGVMILGVFGGGVTFIPSVLASMGGKGEVSSEYLTKGFHNNLLEPLRALSITSKANISYDEPAIYVSAFILAMIVLGFISFKIPRRLKIAAGVFIGFVYLSFSFVPLELLWTALKKTYSFHFRYAFVFSFLLILVAAMFYKEYEKNKDIINKKVANICIIVLPVILIVTDLIKPMRARMVYYCFIVVMVAFMVYIVYGINGKINCIVTSIVVSVLFLGEQGTNTIQAFENYSVSEEHYSTYVKEVQSEVSDIQNQDDSFYRMEKTFSEMDERREGNVPAATEGLTFNYNAITHYSSLYDGSVCDFLYYTGYCKKDAMSSNYVDSNPVMDSLLGLKYLITNKKPALMEEDSSISSNKYEDTNIYVNNNALSFATIVNQGISQLSWFNNPFKNQELILSNITGKEINLFHSQNVKKRKSKKGIVFNIDIVNNGPLYVYMGAGNEDTKIYINGEYKQIYFGRFYKNVIYAGEYKKGDKVKVLLRNCFDYDKNYYFMAEILDEQVYKDIFNALKKKSFDAVEFSDSHIELNYDSKKTETVLLSLPYDEGWTIINNGNKIKAKEVLNGLTAIIINKGDNKIVLNYVPPFLNIGIIISIVSVLIFSIITILFGRGEKNYDMF